MGFIDKFSDAVANAVLNLINPPPAPAGTLIARPAHPHDITKTENGVMALYLQRSNNDGRDFLEVRKKFDLFLPYMLVVEKKGKIIGLGIMRYSGALEKNQNCVTMLMADLNENAFEITQTLIGGFARQALSNDQKTLNILARPGDRFLKQVCESFNAVRTYVPGCENTDYRAMVKYTITDLTEKFVKEWEDDENSDLPPPPGPRL